MRNDDEISAELARIMKPVTTVTESGQESLPMALTGAATGILAIALLRIEQRLRERADVSGAVVAVADAVRYALSGLELDMADIASAVMEDA